MGRVVFIILFLKEDYAKEKIQKYLGHKLKQVQQSLGSIQVVF